jgi:hypothetical protein
MEKTYYHQGVEDYSSPLTFWGGLLSMFFMNDRRIDVFQDKIERTSIKQSIGNDWRMVAHDMNASIEKAKPTEIEKTHSIEEHICHA